MRFVQRDGGVEREWEARLGRPDALVGDLAAALGAGGGLAIDGRYAPAGTPLTGSGLVIGSEVALAGPGGDFDTGGDLDASDRARGSDATATLDPGVVLRIVGGLDAGLSVPLPLGRVRLGRGEEAEIRVSAQDVSRVHCEIEVGEDGRVSVTDLGSRNGTDVNGVRLTGPAVVGPRDVVCAAGRVPFRLLSVAALGPVAYPNPAREAGPGGTLPFNRAPRLATPSAADPVRLPEPPQRAASQPLRISTLLGPLVLAGVMVLVLKNAAYALIALFSPMIMVGTLIEDKIRGRGGLRRRKREYATRLAEARERLAALHREREARLHEELPDPAELCYRATAPGLRLWERRRDAADFLRVLGRLGLRSALVAAGRATRPRRSRSLMPR